MYRDPNYLAMTKDDREELLCSGLCSDIRGRTHNVCFARRNGRRVPLWGPNWNDPMELDVTTDYDELLEELCTNLNHVERRIWLRLIDSGSISEVATEEKVKRPAIYARIHRMARKNAYVAIWWRLRNH